MKFRNFFLILNAMVIAMSVACTQDDPSFSSDYDLVKYDFKLDVEKENLDEDKLKLLEKINASEAISFKWITSIFRRDHFETYSIDKSYANANQYMAPQGIEAVASFGRERLELRYGEILSKANKNILSLKTSYEDVLKAIHGEDLSYDRDYVTMAHPLDKNRLQCFSGTSLFLSLNRDLERGYDYVSSDRVVIFEPGHVLPGFMEKVGDTYYLVGIETTATGDALIDYGPAKNLYDEMRVIEADLYVIYEIFKNELKSVNDGKSFVNFALERAAKKYGIPLENLENLVSNAKTGRLSLSGGSDGSGANSMQKALNQSAFAFGTSNVAAGKQQRSQRGSSAGDLKKKMQERRAEYARQQEELRKQKEEQKRLEGLAKKCENKSFAEKNPRVCGPTVRVVSLKYYLSLDALNRLIKRYTAEDVYVVDVVTNQVVKFISGCRMYAYDILLCSNGAKFDYMGEYSKQTIRFEGMPIPAVEISPVYVPTEVEANIEGNNLPWKTR